MMLRSKQFGFKTIYGLTGRAVDPLLAACKLFYDIIDFHVIGREPPRKALERSACPSLLANTSVLLWTDSTLMSMRGASCRYRPNGELILCKECLQYRVYAHPTTLKDGVVFQCRTGHHPKNGSPVYIPVMFESDADTTYYGGLGDTCRFMIKK